MAQKRCRVPRTCQRRRRRQRCSASPIPIWVR
jgi:hypothetical protein